MFMTVIIVISAVNIFYGTGDIDTNTASLMECIRLNDLWMELVMEEEESQKNGIALILDVGGLPLRLFKFLSPKAVIISALKEEVTVDCNYIAVTSPPVIGSVTHSHFLLTQLCILFSTQNLSDNSTCHGVIFPSDCNFTLQFKNFLLPRPARSHM
jgi:hypothetical protein